MSRYIASNPPEFYDPRLDELARYVADEFRKIEQALSEPEFEKVRFTILNNAIDKPRNGDAIYADGTNWNPGSGAGLYEYKAGAWSKL